jgi:hypothetical protein
MEGMTVSSRRVGIAVASAVVLPVWASLSWATEVEKCYHLDAVGRA